MSPTEPQPTGMSAAFLREQWRAASHASVWRAPGDWHGPAVENMVLALVDGSDAESAAADLGAERGRLGVGLSESLDDLSVLFSLAADREPPYAVTRSFAKEWAEVTVSDTLNRASIDRLTGLATLDYLLVRLGELYDEAAAVQASVDARYCLVVVNAAHERLTGWQKVMRSSLVARILRGVFSRGQTTAILPSGNFAVVAQRDDQLDEWMARLSIQLRANAVNEVEEAPISARIQALPANLNGATDLLEQL